MAINEQQPAIEQEKEQEAKAEDEMWESSDTTEGEGKEGEVFGFLSRYSRPCSAHTRSL